MVLCPLGAHFQFEVGRINRAAVLLQRWCFHLRAPVLQVCAIARGYLWGKYVLKGADAPLADLSTHLRDRICRLRSRRVESNPAVGTFVLESLHPDWGWQPFFNDYTSEYVGCLDYGAVAPIVPVAGVAAYAEMAPGLLYLRRCICTTFTLRDNFAELDWPNGRRGGCAPGHSCRGRRSGEC